MSKSVTPKQATAKPLIVKNVRPPVLSGRELFAAQQSPAEPQLTYAQSQVLQCVAFFQGFTLHNHGQELRQFIARGVDDPAAILDPHVSDCGLFALAVWHAIGVADPILSKPYESGMAISWVLHIARTHGALKHLHADGMPTVGALLYYETKGENDDHVTFLTKAAVLNRRQWLGETIGGGSTDCGIGKATGNILWSWGRPLQAWVDVNVLLPKDTHHATADHDSELPFHEGSLDTSQGSDLASEASPPYRT